VNIVLSWILTLLSSFILTVFALRLRKSQIFNVIVAIIDSSLIENIEFDILDKELCFIDDCVTSSQSWDFSEANKTAQTLKRRRKSSMLKNLSSNRAWSIFFNEKDVFFLISNKRLQEFSKDSINERQRSFSLVISLSLSSRLFSALFKFSAFIKWISHDAEF